MENKRKAMLIGIAGVIVVTLAMSLAVGIVRNQVDEQPGAAPPESEQEKAEEETQQAATPEQEALALLVGSVWKSADGKATITFKDGRYIEANGKSVEFATFDVKQVTARDDGFALTLRLDATKDSEAKDSLPCGFNIRKHQYHDILFPYASRNFFVFWIFCLYILYQGIRSENSRIGRYGLRSCHAYVCLVDTGSRPYPFLEVDAWTGRIGQRVVRKLDLHVGKDAFVFPFLLLRGDDGQLLRVEMPVVGPGDHGGTVV